MSTFTIPRTTGSRARWALLMIAGGLAGTLGAGVASAATQDGDTPTLVVRYDDASLATDSGVQTLYHRLVIAAREVCPDASFRSLHADTLVRQCREQAVTRAIEQIHNSRLAALHANYSKNS